MTIGSIISVKTIFADRAAVIALMEKAVSSDKPVSYGGVTFSRHKAEKRD